MLYICMCIHILINLLFFSDVGISTNCRDDTYLGEFAFSESESLNVASLFQSLKPRVRAFLSVHSYGNMLLHPWGYVASTFDPNPPANLNELVSVWSIQFWTIATEI